MQFRKEAGPYVVTLFSTPSPLRAGPADLSVLVEDVQGGAPVLDAKVSLDLDSGTERVIHVTATRERATNKLLYSALPTISEAGTWRVQVKIVRNGAGAEASGNIQVLPAPPVIVHYWPYFAIVPCLIGLFILNQYLKARKPV